MQVRLATPDDDAAIAAYVAAHPDATAFHRLEWGRAVAKGCTQRAHVLIADGGVRGILPLTELHSPLFGRALASSGFAVGGGILCNDDATGEALAAEAFALAARLSCPGSSSAAVICRKAGRAMKPPISASFAILPPMTRPNSSKYPANSAPKFAAHWGSI